MIDIQKRYVELGGTITDGRIRGGLFVGQAAAIAALVLAEVIQEESAKLPTGGSSGKTQAD